MKTIKFFSLAFITMLLLGSVTTQLKAQTDTDKVMEDFSKWINGESQQDTYYNKDRTKVTVTVKDLDWTDFLSYQGIKESLASGLAGSSNLNVEDITFSPDFNEGFYYLSFSLDEQDDTRIVILDVAGNEVHTESITEFSGTYESRINIPTDLSSGTYFLKVVQGFSLLNKKLVIEG